MFFYKADTDIIDLNNISFDHIDKYNIRDVGSGIQLLRFIVVSTVNSGVLNIFKLYN